MPTISKQKLRFARTHKKCKTTTNCLCNTPKHNTTSTYNKEMNSISSHPPIHQQKSTWTTTSDDDDDIMMDYSMSSSTYPTMMTQKQQEKTSFVSMNNHAVQYNFYHGDSQGATTLLQDAVSDLRQEMGAKLNASILCACSNNGISHLLEQQQQESHELPPIHVQTISLLEQIQQSLVNYDNGYGQSFFDRAFLITNDDENELIVGDNEHKTCCILLYNTGVSHHLQALRTGCNEQLKQALQLYRMALQFLKYAENNGAVQMNTDSSMLAVSLALMNNIAHITSSVYNYEETTNCLNWLRQAVDTFEMSSIIQQEDYRFFFLRYFVMPPSDIPQCAHAA